MITPMRIAFVTAAPRPSDVDFTRSTELNLRSVSAGDTVSFYKAKIAPGSKFVVVHWSDGDQLGDMSDKSRAEIVYPGENGEVILSHTYAEDTAQPVVRITNDLSELRFSGVTINSVGKYDVRVNEFTGASKLRGVVRVGSKVKKVLTQGLFSNTHITSIPSGYSLPSLSSRKAAPCIPLACFMNCSWLDDINNLPTGFVAVDALAFSGCSALTSLSVFTSSPLLKHIGYAAFKGCTGLRNLTGLSCTLTYDSYEALFGGWNNMEEVLEELHPGATRGYRVDQFMFALGCDAFNGCVNLVDISRLKLSGGWLLRGTFSNCTKLSAIPPGVLAMSLGEDTTSWTSSSTSVVYPGGYRFHDISRKVMDADTYNNFLGNDGFGAYERWDSGGVFDGTAIPELPYSRKIILGGEFANCIWLTNVTLSPIVERVAADAFSGCTLLRSVTFQGKTKQQVRGLGYPSLGESYLGPFARAFPFGLPSGCVITCSDGSITV